MVPSPAAHPSVVSTNIALKQPSAQTSDFGSTRARGATVAAAYHLQSIATKQQAESAVQAKEMAQMADRFAKQFHRDATSFAMTARKCAIDAMGGFDFPATNTKFFL